MARIVAQNSGPDLQVAAATLLDPSTGGLLGRLGV
jgi:hypothetical protein